MIPKRSISNPDSKTAPGEIAIKQTMTKKSSSHCSRPLSSSQTTTRPDRTRPAARKADGVPPGASGKPHAPKTDAGGGPGTQKHIRTTPRKAPREPAKPTISSTPARPRQTGDDPRHAGHTTADKHRPEKLRRKEVIQPHLPVRLPCYDFVPIANPTFEHSPHQKAVRPCASGVANFRDVTGGVYKARERIHRSVADLRLLATPPSRSRVADFDPN